MNKRGNVMVAVTFITVLFILVFAGFMLVTGSALVNWVFDIAVPEVSNLGMMDSFNATQGAEITITPLNTLIQSFTWLTGVLYFMALVGCLGMAFVIRQNPSQWLIGFYIGLVFILVLGSIFMSNIYEDFYDDAGDYGDRLREHVLLSYMILYSPMIMSIIAFIGGIILFSGRGEEAFI